MFILIPLFCASFQVIDIPEELIECHDLTVDYILTPTRVIKTNCQHPKPLGIIWSKVRSSVSGHFNIIGLEKSLSCILGNKMYACDKCTLKKILFRLNKLRF